jgi:hypothetical protein
MTQLFSEDHLKNSDIAIEIKLQTKEGNILTNDFIQNHITNLEILEVGEKQFFKTAAFSQ